MESGNPFRLIDVLVSHRVSYVIIGGQAVSFHGFLRATEDADVVFSRDGLKIDWISKTCLERIEIAA